MSEAREVSVPVKINVSEIKRSHGLSQRLRLEDWGSVAELELTAPLVVDLKFTNVGSRILVEGNLQTRVRVACSRCAGDCDEWLDVRVDEQFLPHDSPELPQGEDLDFEQLCLFTYENDVIEIDEVIRQNLVASLPCRPLCAEACKGLCSQCGANLNEKACECEAEPRLDPRWGPLAELQDRAQSGTV